MRKTLLSTFIMLNLFSLNASAETKLYLKEYSEDTDEDIRINDNVMVTEDIVTYTTYTYLRKKAYPVYSGAIKFLGIDNDNNLKVDISKGKIVNSVTFPLDKNKSGKVVFLLHPELKEEYQLKLPFQVEYSDSKLNLKYLGDLKENKD